MNSLTRVLLFFVLCLFTPLVLWLAIAQLADQPTYLALARSGLLLIGLATVGWAGLRSQPRMVWLGLALVVIGFLTFYHGNSWDFPSFDLTESSWFWEIEQSLAVPIAPMSRITFGHMLAGGAAVLNTAILLHDVGVRRLLAANLILVTAIVFGCVFTPR